MKKVISLFISIAMIICVFTESTISVSAATQYKLYWPVPTNSASIGKYSSPFGLRNSPTSGASTNHRGIDIPVKSGTAVYSAYDGVVVTVGKSSVRGNYVLIYHQSIGLSTLYQHLTRATVNKGDTVKGGSQIAVSGNTGIGTGAHLHYGVMVGKATKADNDQSSYSMAINPLGTNISYVAASISGSIGIENLYDFSGTFKVICSSKSVRSGPGGSSGTTRTVYKDNQVKVVGYVYNSYGNLWYKTDKGDYIHPTYLYALSYSELPPSNYCNAQFEVKCASKTSKSDPLGNSDNVKTYTQGNKINVVGYVYNEYGNLWYEISDGSYIYCNYLSVISSDERTPSNYIDTKMKVMASSKTVREDPYSSAALKKTVYKDDTIAVKGYLYNRYGNLWYITDNDYYIYSSYLQQVNSDSKIPSNYIYTYNAVTAEKDYKSEPYSVADSLDTLPSGELINTVGYVINLFGNKWYECEDGGFIYDSSLAPAYYNVSYNANGGTGAPVAQTKTYGKTLTLSTTKPTRTGHTFLGWATSNSATSATYSAGGAYTANSGTTLYAVWKADTYTVSYNANGGSGAPATQTKTYGQTLTLSSTKPSRTGYTFLGWSTSSTATSATYSAGGAYTANSVATLYAVWKADTYTVSYNANGGTGAPSAQTKTYGQTLTLSSTKPSRTGYTFLGWATSSSATSAIYSAGGNYTANSSVTLYAVWKTHEHEFIKSDEQVPDCTHNGYKKYVCANCGEEKSEILPAKGHTVVVISGKTATCTNTGLSDGSECSVCGVVIKAQESIPLIAHNYISKVIAPTANSQGYTLHICSACGNNYKDNYTDPIIENAPNIIVENQTVAIGKTVEVKISIKDNPGITSMRLHVNYDNSALTLVGVKDGGILGTSNHPDNLNVYPYILSWANDTVHENYTDDGTLVMLIFAVSPDAKPGDYDINVSYDNSLDEITDVDLNTVNFNVTNGVVSISNVLIGDVNGDGKVTSKDRIILSRYLDNWDGYGTLANPLAADINGDGKITSKDRIILSRYLDGWGSAYDVYFQ